MFFLQKTRTGNKFAAKTFTGGFEKAPLKVQPVAEHGQRRAMTFCDGFKQHLKGCFSRKRGKK